MHSNTMEGAALTVRTLQRQLAQLLPGARTVEGGQTLEFAPQGIDAPRLVSATILEGDRLCAHSVVGESPPAFRAFLDGTQRSEVVSFVGSVPLVIGSVAAVVRERCERRMRTWQAPLVRRRVYVPRTLLSGQTWSAMAELLGDDLVDTTHGVPDVLAHPYAIRDAAVQRVQSHREQAERRLAERWCESEAAVLFMDGGISGSEAVAVSPFVVGVVKSHQTLYAEGDALNTVLALEHRERSSVFRITSSRRTSVASWYLRIRSRAGQDPLWGLVRAEVACPSSLSESALDARANEVSCWILAEASPLSLPDARWDKMVYGIRDCEEFLRATQ